MNFSTLREKSNYLGTYLIIGEAKCGTSSLYKYLTQHPLVIKATRKELHYFCRTEITEEQYVSLLTSSRTEFDHSFMLGEATPKYFRAKANLNVPQKIKSMIPNVKLILLVRNPIDRAYSNYWMTVRRGNETRPFEETLDNWAPNSVFNYARNLKRWLGHFNRDQILIIKSEDFFSNVQEIYDCVCYFLGLPIFQILDKTPVIPKAPVNTIPNDYPAMDPNTRKKLRRLFMPELMEFHRLTSIWWGN